MIGFVLLKKLLTKLVMTQLKVLSIRSSSFFIPWPKALIFFNYYHHHRHCPSTIVVVPWKTHRFTNKASYYYGCHWILHLFLFPYHFNTMGDWLTQMRTTTTTEMKGSFPGLYHIFHHLILSITHYLFVPFSLTGFLPSISVHYRKSGLFFLCTLYVCVCACMWKAIFPQPQG